MKIKKTPQRMCVGCGQMKDKKSLVRIVCSPEGTVSIDPGGRANGRGAYICRDNSCLLIARKTKKLERAIKSPLNDDVWVLLEKTVGME